MPVANKRLIVGWSDSKDGAMEVGPDGVVKETVQPLDEVPLDRVTRLDLMGHLHGLRGWTPDAGTTYAVRELPPELLRMPHLVALQVKGTRLERLPPWIGELKRLARLEIYDDGLTALPREFGQLPALESLSLAGDQLALDDVLSVVACVPRLRELSLRCDRMTNMPRTLLELVRLETLELRTTKAMAVDSALAKLEGLRHLTLGGKLRALPASLGDLTALESLQLDWCKQLKDLPESFGKWSRLRELEIPHAQLKVLPASFRGLVAIRRVNLRGNRLERIDFDLSAWSTLEALDLGYNRLRTLPEGIARLPRLVEVDLEGNADPNLPALYQNARRSIAGR